LLALGHDVPVVTGGNGRSEAVIFERPQMARRFQKMKEIGFGDLHWGYYDIGGTVEAMSGQRHAAAMPTCEANQRRGTHKGCPFARQLTSLYFTIQTMFAAQSQRDQTIFEYEFWVTGILVGLSIIRQDFLPAVVLSYLVWFALRLVRRQPLVRTPLDWGILLLLGLSLLNLLLTNGMPSAIREKSFEQVLRLWSGVILFQLIFNWGIQKARLNWLLAGLGGVALGLGGFSFISVEWTVSKLSFLPAGFYQLTQSLVSDTVNANVMAGTFVLFMPIAMAIFLWSFSDLRFRTRLGLLLGLAFLSVVMIFTQSRGAILALGVCGVILVSTRWRWGILIILLPVAGLVYFLSSISQNQFLEYLLGGAFGSYDGRLEIWSRAIYLIQDFSFSGAGMGLYGDVVDKIYPFFLFEPGNVPHAHNIFLQIGADFGVPGLITWLAIYLLMIVICVRIIRAGKLAVDYMIIGLGYGLLCSQIALGVHGLLDAVTWGIVRSAPLVWALWAVIMVAHKKLISVDELLINETA
jgi:putative inorganic carbon (HCO3(-)) transporter